MQIQGAQKNSQLGGKLQDPSSSRGESSSFFTEIVSTRLLIAKKAEPSQQYAAARVAHYKTKDLGKALNLCRNFMSAHHETQEAKHSRSQIQHIVSSVVPKRELFDAQVELALVHVANGNSPSVTPNPVAPSVVNSPGEAA